MSQYVVTTPKNPNFKGKVFGVNFDRGRAFISDYTIDSNLGRSVDEIAHALKNDFGYEVKEVQGKPPIIADPIYSEPPAAVPDIAEPGPWDGLANMGKVAEAVTRLPTPATDALEARAEETRKAPRRKRGEG